MKIEKKKEKEKKNGTNIGLLLTISEERSRKHKR